MLIRIEAYLLLDDSDELHKIAYVANHHSSQEVLPVFCKNVFLVRGAEWIFVNETIYGRIVLGGVATARARRFYVRRWSPSCSVGLRLGLFNRDLYCGETGVACGLALGQMRDGLSFPEREAFVCKEVTERGNINAHESAL